MDHYDQRQKLIVALDAYQSGVDGVLLQQYADDTEKPVFSMNKVEKEAFALVIDVEQKDSQKELQLVFADGLSVSLATILTIELSSR